MKKDNYISQYWFVAYGDYDVINDAIGSEFTKNDISYFKYVYKEGMYVTSHYEKNNNNIFGFGKYERLFKHFDVNKRLDNGIKLTALLTVSSYQYMGDLHVFSRKKKLQKLNKI